MANPHSVWLRRRVVYPLLLILLVVGLALRVWNVNFDRGIGSHPDERSTACLYAPTIKLPTSWEVFRDPRQSPLNPLWDRTRQEPRRFTYGHFPLYLGLATGEAMHLLAPVAERLGVAETTVSLMARAHEACDAIAVAGRITIALLDTFTILLLYLLAAAIYGRGVGLLAAAFYAFTAQAIQLSHFFAMDPASTTFTVLAVLGGVWMVQRRTWSAAIVTGVGAGLAIASKFSALPVLAVPVVAAICVLWLTAQEDAEEDAVAGHRPAGVGQARFRALAGAMVAFVVAAVTFVIASPYAVLDWQNFIQATLIEQGSMVRGVADMPFTRQYRNTTPYLYFIDQQVRWGLGWPLGLLALAGTLFAALGLLRTLYAMAATAIGRLVRRNFGYVVPNRELLLLVVWSWVVPYFGLTGAFLAKFNRYMSPLLPFALLFAAGLIWQIWHGRLFGIRRLSTDRSPAHPGAEDMAAATPPEPQPEPLLLAHRLRRTAAVVLALISLIGGIFWSLAYVNGVYNREHTWITASRWMYENIPPNSAILWEVWDDPLPKSIPNEPGMDMGTTGLYNIDWSPYEEDTAEKYLLMREALQAADYVAYSSKRIYDSVDELPERYPLTNLYYQSMFDGSLGFELAAEFASPPRLFGVEFDDRRADESWSLYDHPQVLVFRKVQELSDAEFDARFAGSWESAVPYYRGRDSILSPLLAAVGLGSAPGSEDAGLINRVIALVAGGGAPAVRPEAGPSLLLEVPLASLPVVDDYRWNVFASEHPGAAVVFWWFVVAILGWMAWPLVFGPLRSLRDRGYLCSRTLGWLLAGWVLWWLASLGWLQNSVAHAWLVLAGLALLGGGAAWLQRRRMLAFVRANWGLLLVGEALFAAAYLFFLLIRMANPDIWQPWFGGEKFMEFAFLNGILRSPTFPPVNPHFAGGYINYYYFGIYLVAYLIKLTGIYAEVAFNLAIPTLFALTVVNAFAVAYSALPVASRPRRIDALAPTPAEPTSQPDDETEPARAEDRATPATGMAVGADPAPDWRSGLSTALLAPLFVALLGNLDGFGQLARSLAQASSWGFRSIYGGVETLVNAVGGIGPVLRDVQPLPTYDFWAPSRVIPDTINEFPYWSFLFADLHPHMIGIPFALFFLALVLALIKDSDVYGCSLWPRGAALLALFAFMLGTLASINLWELPTYALLGMAALLVSQYRHAGRINWFLTGGSIVAYLLGAYLAFRPFFQHFTSIGASGIGFVREPDKPETWLLIWGFLLFAMLSWLAYAASQPARPARRADGTLVEPGGLERVISLGWRAFDRLPRLVYLHRRLVQRSTVGYQAGIWLLPVAAVAALLAVLWERVVLALCLLPLALGFVLLWRRGRAADGGAQFALLLTTLGFGILAGTQVVFLKDFLQGGINYRMNTLFKFFMQVWVIWGVAAAIAVPRLWEHLFAASAEATEAMPTRKTLQQLLAWTWQGAFVLLLAASLAYPIFGTPARVDQRFLGWRPPFGTLNGLDYMEQGVYTLPVNNLLVELRGDHAALTWLLENVRGNAVIVESSEIEYYRAMGTRIASQSGLSGLQGMHEAEQRYGLDVARRSDLHREFWNTADVDRTLALIDELAIDLIYVGPLERYQHPEGVSRLERMVQQGQLSVLYSNDLVTIYAVEGALEQRAEGYYVPS